MMDALYRLRNVLLAATLVLGTATAASAQEPKSGALAAELTKLLDSMKVDSEPIVAVAARHPAAADQYVGALYFPGSQLLVVTARYQVPELLNTKLASKAYKDVYIDLNSASVPNTKVFVSDLGCDGLRAKREDNQPYDTIEMRGRNVNFDGDWKRVKLSEDEYMKSYQQAEEEYMKMLQALLSELKKTS
jgi:hypothetical protein